MRERTLTPFWKLLASGLALIAFVALVFGGPASAFGNDRLMATELQAQDDATSYNATLYDSNDYPGVYKTAAVEPNAGKTATDAPAIRIQSIADASLPDAPTTESPAIICGTAVKFADVENARAFTECSARVAPYSYFKYSVGYVMEADGKTPKVDADGNKIKKLSGFDGTYVIVRIDVSKLWEGAPDGSYLHVRQDKNNALLVAVGMDAVSGRNCSFSNLYAGADGQATTQFQRKTASYTLSEMKDADGKDQATPYLDVILFATSSIVAGADAQKEGALTGDVELSFYVDQTADYDPATNWDPASQDATLVDKCFRKFYDEDKVADKNKISRYTVKGSELALETMVMDTGNLTDEETAKVMREPWTFWVQSKTKSVPTTFWSLVKSLQHDYYNQEIDKSADDPKCGRTITLMSEVPVIKGLTLEGASAAELKKRTLDVNSFDIQIANNQSAEKITEQTGLLLKNAWLKIMDSNETTGAELAVGNNATMTIDTGGKLIVDKSCQLEVEWDGATAQQAEGQPAPAADTLNNGALDILAGGTLQNDGVITIEGTEGKPYQPGQEATTEQAKGHGELTIKDGATLTNNGCFMCNGALYVQGTFVNRGKFADTITSKDPDKGLFTYHGGIQVTWKDDVTQDNVVFGGIYVGMDKTWSTAKTYPNATLANYGDIVICPGDLVNEATIKNMAGGHIYSGATDKAIVPIEPDPNNPTVVTKEVNFDEPKCGSIYNRAAIDNQGVIRPAQVTVDNNGSLGDLVVPGNYDDWFTLIQTDASKLTGTGYVYKHDLTRADVELRRNAQTLDSVVYNGTAQWFDVVATMGGTTYDGDKAFKVTCLDPSGATIAEDQIVNAGTYQVVVQGTESFRGKVTKTLTVKPATVTAATLDATSFAYNGKAQKPGVKEVKAGDAVLAAGDYDVAYENADSKDVGTYKVTVTGKGNYEGTASATYKIDSVAITEMTLSQTTFPYTGGTQKPEVTSVKAGSLELSAADYDVAYENAGSKEVGSYKVTVTGKEGGNATGSSTAAYKIKTDLATYEGAVAKAGFTDLDAKAWYMTAENGAFPGTNTLFLDYVIGSGIMSGYAGTKSFGPDDAMSRAMVATVVYRMATGKTAETTDNDVETPFSDVPRGQWYSAAVKWCAEKGIITGFTEGPDKGRFCPDDNTTREQLATITGRYCTKVAGMQPAGADELKRFSDEASISEYAREGVAFCVANGIVNGYTDGSNRFDPQGRATRCQGGKIFAVTAQLLEE